MAQPPPPPAAGGTNTSLRNDNLGTAQNVWTMDPNKGNEYRLKPWILNATVNNTAEEWEWALHCILIRHHF